MKSAQLRACAGRAGYTANVLNTIAHRRSHRLGTLGLSVWAVLLTAGCHAAAPVTATPASLSPAVAATPGSQAAGIGGLEHALEAAAATIRPSVVSITSARHVEATLPGFLRGFRGSNGEVRGMGSGVILDEEGLILTNNHVVEHAETLIVRLDDDREFEARIVGRDPKTDIAVIRILAEDLKPAKLGDSNRVRVGQWVLAAGSPFGLPRSVTAGIVSAMGRGSMGIADYGDFIQTDAAVNQGNSGGPLIDLQGRVVGVNTAIVSKDGGSNGIGFAIPINLVSNVVGQLVKDGVVRRGWLGIVMGEVTLDLARTFDYPTAQGVLVNDLDPKGPGHHAGLLVGDIITQLGDETVLNMAWFRNTVAQTRPGSTINLEVWRAGKQRSLPVVLATVPGDDNAKPAVSRQSKRPSPPAQLGLELKDPTRSLARKLGLGTKTGVVVAAVTSGSVAASSGLRAGDVVLQVGDAVADSAKQVTRELEAADLDKGIRMRVKRGPWARFVMVKRRAQAEG